MLYVRYYIGGQAGLSAAEILSLDNKATGQEDGTITPDRVRVVHEYFIDTMREMKFDQASIAMSFPIPYFFWLRLIPILLPGTHPFNRILGSASINNETLLPYFYIFYRARKHSL